MKVKFLPYLPIMLLSLTSEPYGTPANLKESVIKWKYVMSEKTAQAFHVLKDVKV